MIRIPSSFLSFSLLALALAACGAPGASVEGEPVAAVPSDADLEAFSAAHADLDEAAFIAAYRARFSEGEAVASKEPSLKTMANRVPADCLVGEVSYDVTIVTGTIENAGTDANVQIRLNGRTPGAWTFLNNDSNDDFERGHTDTFRVTGTGLGELSSFELRHDNTGKKPGWYVESVNVTDQCSGLRYATTVRHWLAVDESGGTYLRHSIALR